MNETIETNILSKPFNREDIKNLLINHFLPENFEINESRISIDDIGKFEKIDEVSYIGKSDNPEINLLFIKHKGINDPRITITKETFKIVKAFRFKRSIIVYYSDNPKNYRISLVTLDIERKGEKGTADVLSNPKRYSYFLGLDAKVKTPHINLVAKGRVKTDEDLKERFSVEVVTKEFYKELANWYFWAVSNNDVIFPNSKPLPNFKEISLIRFITRIIFVWFMKQKEIIPEKLFDKNYLKKIVKDFNTGKKSNNYYNAILQNLFFATLNKNIKERAWAKDEGFFKNRNDYGIKNLYRYEDKFLISEKEVLDIFKEIPFLNGGLFDCLDKNDVGGDVVDGFSRDIKKRALMPDYLLFQEEEKEVNLSEFGLGKNEKVKGLFEILNQYNFTIDENTPIDQELSLDPELLGKVFENLLASYNPETATTARKSTGSYYTPREIVDYMVKESLKEYLKTKLENQNIDNIDEKFENLFSYEIAENPFKGNVTITKSIIKHINELKAIDPAVGSGAFPMGMLQKLVFILSKLDPTNELWKELQLENALKETEETLKSKEKNKKEKEEILKDINEVFDENINNPDYARKLYLIENCLYGIDIQPIAIQIAKLRFFISLVLEQNIDREKDNFGIRPLPNLETKLISANTLIGLKKGDRHGNGKEAFESQNIFASGLKEIEDEIKFLRHKYFNAKTRTQKLKYQEKDKQLREKLKDELIKKGFTLENSEKIANFDPYDQNTSSDWFDPEWMFGVTDGFDIVIGNPPYLESRNKIFNKDMKDKYNREIRNIFNLSEKELPLGSDLLIYFYYKSIELVNTNGIICFITHNSWLSSEYGKPFQKFILKNVLVLLIVDSTYRYFPGKKDAPDINTVITFFKYKKNITTNNYDIYFNRYHKDLSKVNISYKNKNILEANEIADVKIYPSNSDLFNKYKFGILFELDNELISIFNIIFEKGNFLAEENIGQGLNDVKDENLYDYNFIMKNKLQKCSFPFFQVEDGAPFIIKETQKYIISKSFNKNIKSVKISTKRLNKKVNLILPRGIGRHFCAINEINAYSGSYVEIYNIKNEEQIKNIWLFLNSSIAWLIREISGRKNLGGGMLKAEASDIKDFPIIFNFNKMETINNLYTNLLRREALNPLLELETKEHKEIDRIVFNFLNISEKLSFIKNKLIKLIELRNKKSKT